ncbi:MAG: DUF3006 domain-containing protein [Pyrinomonadaceae bacterium]
MAHSSKGIHAAIDRIEDGGIAVILIGDDEKQQIELPVAYLPDGAGGGDHLRITITIDKQSRAAAEENVKKLQDELTTRSHTQDKKDFKL